MSEAEKKSGVMSLTNTTMLYVIGNLASKMISFVLVFFTTYYLTKEDLGIYDIILTTSALVSPLIYMQMTDAVLRWLLIDSSNSNTSKIFTNIFCIIIANALIFSILYWIVIRFIEIPSRGIVYCLLLSSTILPLLQIFSRGNGKNTLFAGSSVVYSLIYTIFTVQLVVVYKLRVDGILYANIAANIITFIFIYISGKYYANFDIKYFDFGFCKELIIFSLPLIPNALAWWLFSSANRYIVLYFLGLEVNGIWSISYKIPTILSIFTGIFFMAWQEKAIKAYNDPERDKYYTNILKTYVSLSLGIIMVLTAASKPMMYLLVEKSFWISWKYTVFLMLATFFQSLALFYGVGYYCEKETRHILYTTLIGSLSTIVFSAILVPFLQLYGAGIATLLGFLVMFLIRQKQTQNYFTINYPLRTTFYMFTCILICYFVSFIDSTLVQIINNITAIFIGFYINRKFLVCKLSQWRFINKLGSTYA